MLNSMADNTNLNNRSHTLTQKDIKRKDRDLEFAYQYFNWNCFSRSYFFLLFFKRVYLIFQPNDGFLHIRRHLFGECSITFEFHEGLYIKMNWIPANVILLQNIFPSLMRIKWCRFSYYAAMCSCGGGEGFCWWLAYAMCTLHLFAGIFLFNYATWLYGCS